MKTRIGLAILLAMVMCFSISPVVLADDGDDGGLDVDIGIVGDSPDVGIGIIGDNADVGIGIVGDNANVSVNGGQLANTSDIPNYQAHNTPGGMTLTPSYLTLYYKVRDVLREIYPKVLNNEAYLAGPVSAAVEQTGNQNANISSTVSMQEWIREDIEGLDARLETMEHHSLSETRALIVAAEKRGLARMEVMRTTYNNAIIIFGSILLLMAVGFGVALGRLSRKRG